MVGRRDEGQQARRQLSRGPLPSWSKSGVNNLTGGNHLRSSYFTELRNGAGSRQLPVGGGASSWRRCRTAGAVPPWLLACLLMFATDSAVSSVLLVAHLC